MVMMDPPFWVKVLLPAGVVIATALGGGAWHSTVSNEHRITAVEHAVDYDAKAIDTVNNRQAHVEEKFDHMLEAIGRIEGTLAARPNWGYTGPQKETRK